MKTIIAGLLIFALGVFLSVRFYLQHRPEAVAPFVPPVEKPVPLQPEYTKMPGTVIHQLNENAYTSLWIVVLPTGERIFVARQGSQGVSSTLLPPLPAK